MAVAGEFGIAVEGVGAVKVDVIMLGRRQVGRSLVAELDTPRSALEPPPETGSGQRLPIRPPALAARSQNTIHDHRRNRSDSVPSRSVGTTLSQIVNSHHAVRTG